MLKKGKINFDGGNSEYEVKELYYWLEYIYTKYKDQILIDITKIQNEYHKEFYDIDTSILYDLIETDNADNADKYNNPAFKLKNKRSDIISDNSSDNSSDNESVKG